jgi:signal transduction histidine kinase/ActR/RegA family two-component response regulator
MHADTGPVILADEALTVAEWKALEQWFANEPEWSELPLILLTRPWSRPAHGGTLTARRNTTILCRPIRENALITAIAMSLESRGRQLQVRDLLAKLRDANRKLAVRANQLQRFALALSEAEDAERRRVARLLHDGLQQLLAAARVTLKLAQNERKNRTAQSDALDKVDGILQQAIQSSRKLSHELSPPALTLAGLGPTLEQLAESMNATHDMDVSVLWDADTTDLDENLAAFLYSAVRELLFNVHKHAGIQTAQVILTAEDGHVSLTVSDTGRGFNPDDLKNAPGEYLGLGLFAIRERIELLGGTFALRSSPGKGTSVTLSVPRKLGLPSVDATRKTALAAEDPVRKERSPEKPLRVVIADDHRVMRQGLVSLLADIEGIEVVAEAGNGLEALEAARALRPDVVVMDVSMPRLNGIEATRRLQTDMPDVQVIGLSMLERPGIAEEMLAAGASAYLLKTGPTESLVASILACRVDTHSQRTPTS